MPLEFSRLTALEYLDMRGNALTGTPDGLSGLISLTLVLLGSLHHDAIVFKFDILIMSPGDCHDTYLSPINRWACLDSNNFAGLPFLSPLTALT